MAMKKKSPFGTIKKGTLHTWMGKPQGKPIPTKVLKEIQGTPIGNKWRGRTVTTLRKRQVNFALNARGWR